MEIAKGRQADYGSPPHVPRGSPIPWASPCVCYLLPTHKPVPRSIDIDIGAYIPRWRGGASWQSLERRGQLAASLGAWGLKKDEIGQHKDSKEAVNEVPTFLTCLAAFVEARGVLWALLATGYLQQLAEPRAVTCFFQIWPILMVQKQPRFRTRFPHSIPLC